ncbi:hypothetical protein PFISCL1PPCAC_23236, partial [Pristionchus fissidentatus]
SCPQIVQLYILLLQPVGIAIQMYNLLYLHRLMRCGSGNEGKRGGTKYSRQMNTKPRLKPHILANYTAEYHATMGMLAHLIIILATMLLKYAFATIIMNTSTRLPSGDLMIVMDIIPYTMPCLIGLVSILCITESRQRVSSFFLPRRRK